MKELCGKQAHFRNHFKSEASDEVNGSYDGNNSFLKPISKVKPTMKLGVSYKFNGTHRLPFEASSMDKASDEARKEDAVKALAFRTHF